MNMLPRVAFILLICFVGLSSLEAQPDSEEAGRYRRGHSTVEQRDEAPPSPRGWRDQAMKEGKGQKDKRTMAHEVGGQMLRQVMALKMESEKLFQEEASLTKQEENLGKMIRRQEFSPERIERSKKILVLKAELIDLEQSEFCDKVIAMTDRVITQLEKKLEEQDSDEMNIRKVMMEDMLEKSKALNAAAHEGFSDAYEVISQAGPPVSSWGSGREERWQKEMEMLRDRLYRLETEVKGQS
jgi:hypothetical protein